MVLINLNQSNELQYQNRMGQKENLGIRCVLDRVVQQAILQVIEPIIDPHFSEISYGFRPKRNAHQAIKTSRAIL